MPDEMPQQPTTVHLPAVPDWAIELTKSVKTGFAQVDARLDKQDSKLDKVVTEGIEANTRLTRVEVRLEGVEHRADVLEGRIGRTSTRVQEDSSHDLERDARLAEVIVWRSSVDTALAAAAKKTDVDEVLAENKIQTVLIRGVVESPMAKRIGYAAGALVLQALALATAYLALRGHQ